MSSGIYRIINLCDGKIYVGSAKDIEGRWRAHKSHLRRGMHNNLHLQKSWDKYGESSFKFEILELVPEEQFLIDRECFYVNLYESLDSTKGYNFLTPDRAAGTFHHLERTKQQISSALKGKPKIMTPEHLESITTSNKKLRSGKTYEEIFGKEKAEGLKLKARERGRAGAEERSQKLLGKTYDDLYGAEKALEIKKKMSTSQTGKPQSDAKREKCSISKLGEKNPQYKIIPEDVRQNIIELYISGISRNQISKNLKLNPHQIKKVLLEAQCL